MSEKYYLILLFAMAFTGSACGPNETANQRTSRQQATDSNSYTSNYSSKVSKDSPISYWRFSSYDAFLDLGVSAQNIQSINPPNYFEGGPLLLDDTKAIPLISSTSSIVIPHSPNQIQLPFTAEIFVRSAFLNQGATSYNKIAAKMNWGGSTGGWQLVSNNGEYKFQYAVNYATSNMTEMVSLGLASTQWVHLAVTVDFNGVKTYRDGNLVASGNWLGTPQTSSFSGPLVLGQNSNLCDGTVEGTDPVKLNKCRGEAFQGAVDEFAIYPVVLTASQIKAHYDAAISQGLQN
ncbi:MAG: LamG domain-containing protein [Deltaproteobacteria bacterium]|nr:LamG domain-containing protein [Deltaproteobacteria bacterium]